VLIYKCPRGHLYATAGYGEDLVAMGCGAPARIGRMHDCPNCKHDFGPNGPPYPPSVGEEIKEGK
jgi:hypothetical protein